MRKFKLLLSAFCIIILISPAQLSGQENYGEKKFPEIPQRSVRTPDSQQLEARLQFEENMTGWSMRWNEKTGGPASMYGLPAVSGQGTPEAVARQFLARYAGLYKMEPGLSDLFLLKSVKMLRATHVNFQQRHRGIPVEGGICAVNMTNDGKIYLVNGDYYSDVEVSDNQPRLPLTDAISSAESDLGSGLNLSEESTGGLVILPYGDEFRLAWKITVAGSWPFGRYIYYISAADGEVLGGLNKTDSASRDGEVYDHHPEYASPVSRTLHNLDDAGYELVGTYLYVLNDDGAEAYVESGDFDYNPGNTHFDEVNVYYHVDRFQDDFLQDIGYAYLNYPSSLVQVEARVHYGTNWNNAGANPPKFLVFGDGDSSTYYDYAKEDDVIAHEYTHLVTEYITYNGLDASGNYYDETDAMDEAFSDYFGCSYAGSPLYMEYVKAGAGSERNLDNSYDMDDWDDSPPDLWGSGAYHNGGQIFSGALWDIRQEMGSQPANIIILEGLDNLNTADPDFLDGREAIISADNTVYSGSHVNAIKLAFYNHGIGDPPPLSSPTNFTWSDMGYPRLSWSAVTEADSYTIRRIDDNGTFYFTNITSTSYDDETVETGEDINTYEYSVKSVNQTGSSPYTDYIVIGGQDVSKKAPVDILPTDFGLSDNYPNPFNPVTQINYQLPEAGQVTLNVYDITGKQVAELVDEFKPAGYYNVNWDARNLASGVYLYRMTSGNYSKVKRMVLIR